MAANFDAPLPDDLARAFGVKRKYPGHWGGRNGKQELRRAFEYVRGGLKP